MLDARPKQCICPKDIMLYVLSSLSSQPLKMSGTDTASSFTTWINISILQGKLMSMLAVSPLSPSCSCSPSSHINKMANWFKVGGSYAGWNSTQVVKFKFEGYFSKGKNMSQCGSFPPDVNRPVAIFMFSSRIKPAIAQFWTMRRNRAILIDPTPKNNFTLFRGILGWHRVLLHLVSGAERLHAAASPIIAGVL